MSQRKIIITTILLASFSFSDAEMDGLIVHGDYIKIKDFPHSAFLGISCQIENRTHNWACGSSIVNHVIILTAAHCLEECHLSSYIGVGVGSEHKRLGITHSASKFLLHSDYNPKTVENDIALVRLMTPLIFSSRVKRVALMKNRPRDVDATVAGWGLVDEEKHTKTLYLKETKQKVWTMSECVDLFDYMIEGTMCAGNADPDIGYAAEGDSGSALVVKGYIQIGIVSHKFPTVSSSVVIYTDIAHFYDWIKKMSRKLYCEGAPFAATSAESNNHIDDNYSVHSLFTKSLDKK